MYNNSNKNGKRQHSEYDIRYYILHLKAFTAIAVLNRLLNNKKDQENTLKETKNLLNAVLKAYITKIGVYV